MHEMSLCEGILQIVEDAARRAGAGRVTRVRLAIGAFSGAEITALRFCFDAVARGTLAERAALEIEEVAGTAFCLDCAESVSLPERLAPCPVCGGGRLVPDGGGDIQVKDIDVL